MATVYAEDWAAGNSLFTSIYNFQRPTHGVDPLYPYVRAAEGVYINGDGRLDKDPSYTGEYETYQQTGVWIQGPGSITSGGPGFHGGPGFWNATYGCMQSVWYPTTESLAAINPDLTSCPLMSLVRGGGYSIMVGADVQLEDGIIVVYHIADSHDLAAEINGAPMPVAGEPYTVRMGWQCGTYDEATSTAQADGFVRLWINEELIYEAANISLLLNPHTVPGNLVDSALFGYFGMIGPLDSFSIADSACTPVSSIVFKSGRTSFPLVWSKILLKVTE